MKIAFASDTHGRHAEITVPPVDVLVLAGDVTAYGTSKELKKLAKWIDTLPIKRCLIVSGNHDHIFQRDMEKAIRMLKTERVETTYIKDSAVIIDGIVFYATPWTRALYFDDKWAFGLKEEDLPKVWAGIPSYVHVLITHMPPLGVLDQDHDNTHLGDPSLLQAVVSRKPKVHVFGHIHESSGMQVDHFTKTTFINAAICNENYEPINPVKVLEI